MEEDSRMQWKGKLEFFFTTFGYTVGLGNIWRFPYKCYVNGGGAFLLPYFMAIVFCTLPLLFMEMALGQFASMGSCQVWMICPLLSGIGWAICFNLFMTVIYYIILVTYSFYYLLVSFVNIGGKLPWQHCSKDEVWITENCRADPLPDFSLMSARDKIVAWQDLMNSGCIQETLNELNLDESGMKNMDYSVFRANFSHCDRTFTTPEDEYWNRFVLEVHESGGFGNPREVVGRNALLLIIVWLFVLYCCVKGIRSIAKVAYVTATFPFGLLLLLLIMGITLEGHVEGINYYIIPDWSKLLDLSIWSSAVTQAIYSTGIAFGSHIALSSHNSFNNNVFRDSLIISLVNTSTSILSGFVVFCFIGHASFRLNIPIDKIFDQGPGILFISYVQGISNLPASAVWSFFFFLMVFTLGVDSHFIMFWTLFSNIEEAFPKRIKKRRFLYLLGLCCLTFLLCLPLVTKGGMHIVVMMDRYVADFTLTFFAIVEAITICWVYGVNRFINDIEMMIGKKSLWFWWFWKVTWAITAPAVCLFIFIASAVGYESSSYNGITLSPGGEAAGILMIITPFLIFLVFIFVQVKKHGGFKAATVPSTKWRPRLLENRTGPYQEDSYITPCDMPLDRQDSGVWSSSSAVNSMP